MENNQLLVTLDGPRIGESGVPVDEFTTMLKGVQDALRLMVEHLGERQPGPGPRPKWVRDQSVLQLVSIHHGSLVAELTLRPPPEDGQLYLENYGERALNALRNWDGSEGSTLPKPVTEKLKAIPASLPDDMRVWLGDRDNLRRVEVKSTDTVAEIVEALLYGWLKEVNWDKGTAQLHRYMDNYVQLRFDSTLDEDMVRFATQYVRIRGRGRFDDDDLWDFVQVEEISGTRSWREPFDLDEFLNDPNPKVFDPDKLVTASEPFDADEFNRIIREGRDVREEGYPE